MIVGALLRAGYRSAQAYFAAAKRQHIEMYKTWDCELDLIVGPEVARASKRGMGTPSRTAPFPLLTVACSKNHDWKHFSIPDAPADSPIHPWTCAVLGTWSLFREIELANVTLADVRMSKADKTLTILASI